RASRDWSIPMRPGSGPRAGLPRPDPRRTGRTPPVGVRVDPRPDHEARDGPDEAVPPRAQEDREEDADRRTRHQTDGRVTEAPVRHVPLPLRPPHGGPLREPRSSARGPADPGEREAGHTSSSGADTAAVSGAMSR